MIGSRGFQDQTGRIIIDHTGMDRFGSPFNPEKDREKMVGFAVELSCRDFSGKRAELGDTEALALWEKYLPDSVYTWYLKSVLAETPRNMDRYAFGGTPEP